MYPWWGKAVCHRSHVGKHCTDELHSHRLLQRWEMNRCDPGTWKKQTDLITTSLALSFSRRNEAQVVETQENKSDHKWFGFFISLFASPEKHLFQLPGYHGNKGGSSSVEHVQLHIGRHDLCGDICVCGHASPTATTEHPGIQTMDGLVNMNEVLGLSGTVGFFAADTDWYSFRNQWDPSLQYQVCTITARKIIIILLNKIHTIILSLLSHGLIKKTNKTWTTWFQ